MTQALPVSPSPNPAIPPAPEDAPSEAAPWLLPTIRALNLKPGQVLLVRYQEDVPEEVQRQDYLALRRWLAAHDLKAVRLLSLSHRLDLEVVDEAYMAARGWVRARRVTPALGLQTSAPAPAEPA